MTPDAYISLADLAKQLGIRAKNPVEAVRKRCERRQVPIEKRLGVWCVLKVSIDEDMKRERQAS